MSAPTEAEREDQGASDDFTPPTRADIYPRSKPAVLVVEEVVGCDRERAVEILRGIAEGGYFIAPRVPTDAMLAAYFSAYGQQAWTPRTIIQNIGKARLRWVAMGQSGTAMALSRRFLPAIPNEDAPTSILEREA